MGALALVIDADVIRKRAAESLGFGGWDDVRRLGAGGSEDGFLEVIESRGLGRGSLGGGRRGQEGQQRQQERWQCFHTGDLTR